MKKESHPWWLVESEALKEKRRKSMEEFGEVLFDEEDFSLSNRILGKAPVTIDLRVRFGILAIMILIVILLSFLAYITGTTYYGNS
ncbi:MAG: hypothetical protein OXE44_09105 [Nitrospinae bacterium]|nr:hypothetical protein [Nitrospinota bacterium]